MKRIKNILNFIVDKSRAFLRTLAVFTGKLWAHKKGRVGVILVGLIILVTFFAPLLTPYDPKAPDITNELKPPSLEHPLGTDNNGTDILAQVLYGTRVSLAIGLITGISVTLLGAFLGILAGYLGKIAEGIIMRTVDVLLVIPTLPLMIILNKYVSSSYLMMIAIFVFFGWQGTARIIRAQVKSIKTSNYIKAAELSGAGRLYIMFVHILPGVSHLLIMNCALSSAGFMIAEAGLSFLGLGDPNAVSWGRLMVNAEQGAFTSRLWAWVLAPGFAIFITVIGFMQIGYALEEIFNPRISKISMNRKISAAFSPKTLEENFSAIKEPDDSEIEYALSKYKLPKKGEHYEPS